MLLAYRAGIKHRALTRFLLEYVIKNIMYTENIINLETTQRKVPFSTNFYTYKY